MGARLRGSARRQLEPSHPSKRRRRLSQLSRRCAKPAADAGGDSRDCPGQLPKLPSTAERTQHLYTCHRWLDDELLKGALAKGDTISHAEQALYLFLAYQILNGAVFKTYISRRTSASIENDLAPRTARWENTPELIKEN